jgi:type 1 fimbriae regulatory protein FimB
MSKTAPLDLRGFQRLQHPQTLDKMNDDRKHLTGREIEKLIAATKGSRNESRDRCLLLLMFRHGLRVSEAVGLKLSHVDLEGRTLHVARLKRGLSTTHPLRADELRVLRAWLAIRRYGEAAGLEIAAHPHMLRHACGFALADQGADTRLIQDYLGHRNIQHTVRYTATNPARFERLWR